MNGTRREFLGSTVALASAQTAAEARPNVVLIMTDDQGWADLGCHGNPHLKTPHLDRLASQSVEFTNFCVAPLCAPTRASLMTGRYYYRTGVTDTYKGKAILDPRETTIAEMLRTGGYRTGIFGKWHLGDCYPTRPIDRGFDEELVHLGGGLAQPSATKEDGAYFDPRLRRNGAYERVKGYCTDVFTDAAIGFIERNRERPFFAYLATNAPHDPYIVAEKYSAPYRAAGLPEKVANIYGMIANIDENVGRLLAKLDELKLAENTIVIFLTDNGATNSQFTGGLRSLKASVYEGGIKSPLFVRWPAKSKPARVDQMAAMIDLTPTLLDACRVAKPAAVKFDGVSLVPQMMDARAAASERTVFIQIHRGDSPDKYRNFCARTQRWKLLHAVPIAQPNPPEIRMELYDLESDPGEQKNRIDERPEIAARLRAEYEKWFADVGSSRGYEPVRFVVGTKNERVTELTRQDWHGLLADWGNRLASGYWEIEVQGKGKYDVEMRFPPFAAAAEAELRFQTMTVKAKVAAGAGKASFKDVKLPAGPGRIEGLLTGGGETRGAHFIDIRWKG